MKSIEETHPSIERTFRAHKDASEFVLGKDVQAHTIDKAVLKKVIRRLENRCINNNDNFEDCEFIQQVFAEAKEVLGLEEEE